MGAYKYFTVDGQSYRLPRCQHGGPIPMTKEDLTNSVKFGAYYTSGAIFCDTCNKILKDLLEGTDKIDFACETCNLDMCQDCIVRLTPAEPPTVSKAKKFFKKKSV